MSFTDSMIMWLHLTCASIWVGGSIFLGIVLSPMLKTITKTVEERVTLMIKIGRQFNKIAMPSFGILIITGIYNSRSFFEEPSLLLDTKYGIILLIKIILVVTTISTYAVHVKILNTEAERKIEVENAGNIYVQSIRSKIISLGRITVILSILILLFAALLHNGGL
ncbi:MAG: CopD family protein [Nitrososphaeraceae archaeon]|jgi:copper resistance protein D